MGPEPFLVLVTSEGLCFYSGNVASFHGVNAAISKIQIEREAVNELTFYVLLFPSNPDLQRITQFLTAAEYQL